MKYVKQKQSYGSRVLSLFLTVLMAVQLVLPAAAVQAQPQPVETEGLVTEQVLPEEGSELPAEEKLPMEEVLPTEEERTEVAPPVEEAPSAEEPGQETAALLTADAAPEAAAQVAEAPSLPGYTRLTKADELVPGKYYLLVSRDSNGGLYAFYPNEAFKDAPSGDAVVQQYAGAFVADLTVDGQKVSAKLDRDQSTLSMDALRFTVEPKGNQVALLGSNGLYLAMGSTMLSDHSTLLGVAVGDKGFRITNGVRFLDFNKQNDPMSFNPGAFFTNFWGPKGQNFPLYIYAQDGAVAPTVVKGALRTALAAAEAMLDAVSDQSRTELEQAIANGKKAMGSDDQKQIDAATEQLKKATLEAQPREDMIAKPAPQTGTTVGQPFPAETGSDNVRIPAIITLKDGTLVAAADARWDHRFDGDNIDTMVSVSKDNGATWNYSFPNYFNDSCRPSDKKSTVFIDPVLLEGKDGTIYMMVDAYSGGNWTMTLHKSTGYEEINGKMRMVLYKEVLNNQVDSNWSFYVGDFAPEGNKSYAPVYARDDDKTPVAYVDAYYYLYSADKKPLYCPQLGSDKFVQQNVFFYNASYHVANACFLWLISSKDHGQTWSAPTILNPMVRRNPAKHIFYGVGPGSGLCLSDGTLMLPVYEHEPERAAFVYSNDNGTTWHRSEGATTADWSSESFLVELDVNTVRHFYRDGHNVLRYTDHTRNPDNTWSAGQPVRVDGAIKTTGCQISGVKYTTQLDGRDVILVSTAASGSHARQHGRVYTFAVNHDKDHTMELIGTYEVNAPNEYYAYSSITVQKDGTVGLLYEDGPAKITYRNITLKELLNVQEVDVPLDTATNPEQRFPAADASKQPSNSNPGVVNAEVKTTALPEGMGRTGENKNYDGAIESLATALYTFRKDGGKWQASAVTADGTQVWLNAAGEVGYPFATTAVGNTFDAKDKAGVYAIHTPNAGGQERYLAFTMSDTHSTCAFDGGMKDMGEICNFKLYAPVENGQPSSKEVPGYRPVETIQDGGRYLVVYTYGDQSFVLRPSVDTANRYAHVLKVVTSKTELVLTAVSAGTADVSLGNVVYHVTVTDGQEHTHAFGTEWQHDETGHWHGCSCGAKQDEAAHTFGDWTVTKEATEREAGQKVHRCTVCGYEETVEIPALSADPNAPVDPSAPTKPSNPNGPTQGKLPATGDSSPVLLWVVVLTVSTLCLAAVVVYEKKKQHLQ